MIKSIDELSVMDILKKPRMYNQLIKATANRFSHLFFSIVDPKEMIADIGAGNSRIIPDRYRYLQIDYCINHHPDIVGSALSIPLRDASIDHVFCSWAFEHFEEPEETLIEFNRIIKPGGYLYLTTNFLWHLHEKPRDFFRYTEYGLRYLFEKQAWWEIILIKPTAGFWLTVLQMLAYKIAQMLRGVHPVVTVPLQVLAFLMEKVDFDSSAAAGFCVIARNNKSRQQKISN